MHPYLRASILSVLAGIIVSVLILASCAAPTMRGVCRHEATYAITVYGELAPVRVAVGQWGQSSHAKAQAYLDGRWTWLCVNYPYVSTCAPDYGFNPTHYYAPWAYYIWMNQLMIKENLPR